MTVGELLRRISSRELSEWMAYYGQEPFGDVRADLQAGIIASTIANVNRDPKKQHKGFEPDDFMARFWDDERAKKSPSEIYNSFKTWALISQGKKPPGSTDES